MSNNIINFKENFFGGTRSNRFLVSGSFPTGGNFTNFHIRSTLLPQLVTRTLSYDFFGRKYHYPGEKDYQTWTFTVLDDTGAYDLWRAFQRWQNSINNHETNVSAEILSGQQSYKAYNWRIQHLDLSGNQVLKEFVLHGCWPASVNQLTLNMTSPNTPSSFSVLIVFDYIEITGVTSRT
jgi:hypothetical protein